MTNTGDSGSCDLFIYAQHLLGTGHLRRAAALAQEAARQRHKVVLVSGGAPVAGLALEGVDFVQLPALRSRDVNFSGLLDENGAAPDETFKARRRTQLLATFQQAKPKVLLLELFPFGRRQLRFELLPLLEAAAASSPRPLIACSLRDVLNKADAKKTDWMVETANHWLDMVLVHADPALITLADSFPSERLTVPVHHTGFIAEAARLGNPSVSRDQRQGVLVSAGGGAVGVKLLQTAMMAKAASKAADQPWLLLAGQNMPQADFSALEALAREDPGIDLQRHLDDFPTRLGRAALSISQAGYNTVLETLATDVPAILVPFAAPGESEQTQRAATLEKRKRVLVVREEQLTAEQLARAIDATIDAGLAKRHTAVRVKLDGAARALELLFGPSQERSKA